MGRELDRSVSRSFAALIPLSEEETNRAFEKGSQFSFSLFESHSVMQSYN